MLSEKENSTQYFSWLVFDLIGPWSNKISNNEVTFLAIKIIGTVNDLTKLVRVNDKIAEHVPNKFAFTSMIFKKDMYHQVPLLINWQMLI